MSGPAFDVVIPTIGRPSLLRLLHGLAASAGPPPGRIVIVDDRRPGAAPLALGELEGALPAPVLLLARGGHGPASARNLGWRACDAAWVAFLDDDVLPAADWLAACAADLAAAPPDAAGSQGRLRVPRPAGRPPDDWERHVIGLEGARWITADMAYRREVLAALGGFDERFRRAWREDSELALRALAAGHRLVQGRRRVVHPIGPRPRLASVRAQAGNADDELVAALHGRRWRAVVPEPRGRFRRHAAVTAAGIGALASAAGGFPTAALLTALAWGGGTAELAAARIAPGPRTPAEVARMIATSLLIPPVAVWHRLRGRLRAARLRRAGMLAWRPPEPQARGPLRLVLFDRDGTLIADDPDGAGGVEPMPTAEQALARLRAAGVRVAVVTNQPRIAGDAEAGRHMAAVHAEMQRRLGPIDGFFVCPHAPEARCLCRKPAPGLLLAAMRALGVPRAACALVGDIGSDVEAARAAGVRSVLVPTAVTRPAEIRGADVARPDLDAAVRWLLEGSR